MLVLGGRLLLSLGALAVTAPAAHSAATVRDLPHGLVPVSAAAGPDGRTWFVAVDRRMYADFSTPEGASSYPAHISRTGPGRRLPVGAAAGNQPRR